MNRERKKIVPGDIIGLLMCVVFVPIIVVNLILIVNSYRNPDELPGVFGVKPAVVLSGSMEPAIETGDLILLRDTDPLALEKGDVICYLSSGKAVTHRIVGITAGEDGRPRYVTQGDANSGRPSACDAGSSAGDLVGRADRRAWKCPSVHADGHGNASFCDLSADSVYPVGYLAQTQAGQGRGCPHRPSGSRAGGAEGGA